MKAGTRALGIAESYSGDESTVAGCVVRTSRVVDGFAFSTCTVGGTDATDAIVDVFDQLDREDIQYLLVAGIAPAWFNIVDLHRLHEATGLPTLSVSFEASSVRVFFDSMVSIFSATAWASLSTSSYSLRARRRSTVPFTVSLSMAFVT